MSVRKRKWAAPSGDLREAWVVDYKDGQGRRRLKTFNRKKDADVFLASAKVEIGRGEHVADSASVSLNQAGEIWLSSSESNGLERSTLDQYRQHLRLHIQPFLGRELISRLTVPKVRAFQDDLAEAGRSPAMVKRVTTSLGAILAEAQERGLVNRNVVRELSRKRGRRSGGRASSRHKKRLEVGVEIPTSDEIKAIVNCLSGRYRPVILTAIFTGLRASELRGLRWVDVDFKNSCIHVRQRADRYDVLGSLKSTAATRRVPLPPIVLDTLKGWRQECPQGEHDLMFPNGRGNVESLANIINRGLVPPQAAAGVLVPGARHSDNGGSNLKAKYTGMHCLRHFYASWLINRKQDGGLELPPKMVQERLGHSSIVMTMDVYGHLFPQKDSASELKAAQLALLGK